jgi:hypothetical protein
MVHVAQVPIGLFNIVYCFLLNMMLLINIGLRKGSSIPIHVQFVGFFKGSEEHSIINI